MDLIIQVNPPTFLCCFSHTWASEDDERWVGKKRKGRRVQGCSGHGESVLSQGAALLFQLYFFIMEVPNYRPVKSSGRVSPQFSIYLEYKNSSILFSLSVQKE